MSGTLSLTAAVTPTLIRMSIVRAKSAIYYIDVNRTDGTPFDLTDAIMYFYASNGDFSLSKSSVVSGSPATSQGIIFSDSVLGLATLTIDPADTESLGSAGVFGMPCEFTLVSSRPAGTLELATGNLTVTPNVGTP